MNVKLLIAMALIAALSAGEPAAPENSVGVPPKIEFSVSQIPDEALEDIVGVSWKEGCPVAISDLRLVKVAFVDFGGVARSGELVAHKAVAEELADIFRDLFVAGFPIERVELIDRYGADDGLSMEANNSSAFNYRTVAGTSSLSMHAYGLAVDINPAQNPYISRGNVSPEAARAYLDRSDARPGMVLRGGAAHEAFTSRGWTWGGDWTSPVDYQHFQKNVDL